jgi:transposase
MRKSINGLSDLVANELKLDAMSGQYFVFCGRHRNTLKILYWLRHVKLRKGGWLVTS